MTTREEIERVVLKSIVEVNKQFDPGRQVPATREATLFGRGGALDSVGLVTLIVETEQRLEDECGISLTLADERAMSRISSPFRSVQALTDYILEVTTGGGDGDR